MKLMRSAISLFSYLLKFIVKRDEYSQFVLAEYISSRIYPKLKFSEFGRRWLEDSSFFEYYESVMDKENWHSADRKFNLRNLMNLIKKDNEANLIEFGAYKGASALLMCEWANERNGSVYLLDSFKGLSEPGPKDGNYWQKSDLRATVEDVQKTLTHYSNFEIFPGYIPDSLKAIPEKVFDFAHFDLDLFQPTLDSLNYIYPRMSKGGVLVFDDYGFLSCPGVTSAVDQFFVDKQENVVEISSGQAFVVIL
ncbi:MAG: hypothetical protein F2709_02370 [Actinobacteria bacterium]|nr:hypothetical protein [Actinomycetota bacterium]